MPQMIPPEAVKWRWLAAVIPHYYGKNRNGCMVYYLDGKSQLVQARCERVLECWMEYCGTYVFFNQQHKGIRITRKKSPRGTADKARAAEFSPLCGAAVRPAGGRGTAVTEEQEKAETIAENIT